jgi:hypothetical protein
MLCYSLRFLALHYDIAWSGVCLYSVRAFMAIWGLVTSLLEWLGFNPLRDNQDVSINR